MFGIDLVEKGVKLIPGVETQMSGAYNGSGLIRASYAASQIMPNFIQRRFFHHGNSYPSRGPDRERG